MRTEMETTTICGRRVVVGPLAERVAGAMVSDILGQRYFERRNWRIRLVVQGAANKLNSPGFSLLQKLRNCGSVSKSMEVTWK